MTLEELVRSKLREGEDAIGALDEREASLASERAAVAERISRTREEAERRRVIADERDHSVQDCLRRVEEIDLELKDLAARREEQQKLADEAKQRAGEAHNAVGQAMKWEEAEQKTSRRIDAAVRAVAEERNRLTLRLGAARCSALTEYLSLEWKRLSALAARQGLEAARRNDPALAAMYEAREEWRRIIAGPAAAMVKTAAKSELRRIEDELRGRFPGALDIEAPDASPDEIVEVFYTVAGDQPGLKIFLPLSEAAWRQMEQGAEPAQTELAARLMWEFARSLPATADRAQFQFETGRCTFVTGLDEASLQELDEISLPLKPGGAVSFILTRLPSDVDEALRQETVSPISDPAGEHPAARILAAARGAGTFEEFWLPARTAPEPADTPPPPADKESARNGVDAPEASPEFPFGHDAAHVLNKLERKNFWGSHSISFDALRIITNRSAGDLRRALAELRDAGFLDETEGRRGTYSLNPGRKRDITTALAPLRSRDG